MDSRTCSTPRRTPPPASQDTVRTPSSSECVGRRHGFCIRISKYTRHLVTYTPPYFASPRASRGSPVHNRRRLRQCWTRTSSATQTPSRASRIPNPTHSTPSLRIAHCPRSRFVKPSSRGRMSCSGAAPDIADGPQPEATRQHLGPTRDETTLEERKKKKKTTRTKSNIPTGSASVTHALGESWPVRARRGIGAVRSAWRGRRRRGGAGTHHDRADVALDGRGGEQDVCARRGGRACSDQERDRGGEGKKEVGTYRLVRGLHGARRRWWAVVSRQRSERRTTDRRRNDLLKPSCPTATRRRDDATTRNTE